MLKNSSKNNLKNRTHAEKVGQSVSTQEASQSLSMHGFFLWKLVKSRKG